MGMMNIEFLKLGIKKGPNGCETHHIIYNLTEVMYFFLRADSDKILTFVIVYP